MKLRSVRVQRFKRVKDVTFEVKDLNILVGGNNSGKSTIVQALHFGIALLQTIQATGLKWPKSGEYPTSLNPNDIIYSPSEDVLALVLEEHFAQTKTKVHGSTTRSTTVEPAP